MVSILTAFSLVDLPSLTAETRTPTRLTFALRGDGEDVDYGNIDAAQATLNAVDADGVIKTPVQQAAPVQAAPQPAAFMRFKTEAEMFSRVGVLVSAVKEGRST